MRCGRREILKSLIALPLGYIFVKNVKAQRRGPVIETTAYLIPAQAGQSAIFTVTKPNRVIVTQSVLTDAQGIAFTKFQLNKKDPSGVYTATVTINSVKDSGSVII